MRLTTKIVIGIISSLFLLAIVYIITLSFSDKKKPSDKNMFSQDHKTELKLPPYKTIWLDIEKEKDIDKPLWLNGSLTVVPVSDAEKEYLLSLPEELQKRMTTEVRNDTLHIKLIEKKMREYLEQQGNSKDFLFGVNLTLHSNFADVISNVDGIDIKVNNLETDHIKVNVPSRIFINGCTANLVEPTCRGSKGVFRIDNSQVKNLKIDLDNVGWWTVENCQIEEENLTGKGTHRVEIPKRECRAMNWIPKDKKARLEVTLYGDTARVFFP